MGELKVIHNESFKKFFFYKKGYIFIFLLIFFYSLYLLATIVQMEGNIYDYLLQLTELHPMHYGVTPLFLIALTLFLPPNNIDHYLMIRFKNKTHWYNMQFFYLGRFTLLFLVIFILVMFLQSFLSLSFHNEWSEFAQLNYIKETGDLKKISPLTAAIFSLILLWFNLFLKSLIFYSAYLIKGSLFFALFIVFLLSELNSVSLLSYWDNLSVFLPFNYVNVFISLFHGETIFGDFFYGGLIYYLVLSIFFFIVGLLLFKKSDIEKYKAQW
ncbi:hypothetical protein K6959_00675 [Bacillus aquiflavi]|uniref:hypothetical protein n=1 Tax=Bacillus aquiflavi TaxID=2672567 RepID=UPI001CA7E2FC|nr:hypothetical protein [Bacillus aquiflavi]UAC48554.1 hypothetical protein K6959_00675 [Bacillus aquiflavi]